MPSSQLTARARIPSVDVLLRDDLFAGLIASFGRTATRDTLREVLADLRTTPNAARQPAMIATRVERVLHAAATPSLRPVFNLTGTILHTNLGRAPLPDVAIEAMVRAAGAVNLEYDLAAGQRGQRDEHVADWIKRLTGAEAAIVVNNNAAAVMIVLNTLALDQQVIVSRGELIEIGGAFRMPDIMARAGCALVETGTTNRTHLSDFKTALRPQTAMLLKVHTSNYQVEGFTKSVPERDLAELAHAHDLPLVVDLGSGALIDLSPYGLPRQTTVRETLQSGADLVTFSGDKLLGGPQAGIIAGRADLIAQIAANPMKRAMRLDKITLAALEAVLGLYAHPEALAERMPTLRLLSRTAEDIRQQAERLAPKLSQPLENTAHISVTTCQSQIGSGALPVDLLDSFALSITPIMAGDHALRALSAGLRALPCPVIGRLQNGAILCDLRALDDENRFVTQFGLLPDAADADEHQKD